MRLHFLGLVLLAGVASPVLAQRAEPVEQRVDRIERELRAVQRRVFPNGRTQFVEPEIGGERPAAPAGLQPGGDALSTLTARVDALEGQLRSLTGQIEEQGFRSRQIEEQLTRLRTDVQARLDRIEHQAQPAQPEPAPATAPNVSAATPRETEPEPAAPSPSDPAEQAYNAGYRLWNERRYAEAQQALEAAATQYPESRWTSWMRNLQGRAYLDDNKPATAARILLNNYQSNPRGDRAADSLFYLGQSLTRLNRRAEACRVYEELEQVYPNMRDFLRTRLPDARAAARCTAPSR